MVLPSNPRVLAAVFAVVVVVVASVLVEPAAGLARVTKVEYTAQSPGLAASVHYTATTTRAGRSLLRLEYYSLTSTEVYLHTCVLGANPAQDTGCTGTTTVRATTVEAMYPAESAPSIHVDHFVDGSGNEKLAILRVKADELAWKIMVCDLDLSGCSTPGETVLGSTTAVSLLSAGRDHMSVVAEVGGKGDSLFDCAATAPYACPTSDKIATLLGTSKFIGSAHYTSAPNGGIGCVRAAGLPTQTYVLMCTNSTDCTSIVTALTSLGGGAPSSIIYAPGRGSFVSMVPRNSPDPSSLLHECTTAGCSTTLIPYSGEVFNSLGAVDAFDNIVMVWAVDTTYGATTIPAIKMVTCSLSGIIDRSEDFATACEFGDATAQFATTSPPTTDADNFRLVPMPLTAAADSSNIVLLSSDGTASPRLFQWVISRTQCQPGSESRLFQCSLCPTGTFLSTITNKCSVCPTGTFSNTEGSSSCSACQIRSRCPPGSTTDTSFSLAAVAPTSVLALGRNDTTAFEPRVYSFLETRFRDPDKVSHTLFVLGIVWIVVAGIVLLLYMAFTILMSTSKGKNPESLAAKSITALAAMDIFFRVDAKTVDRSNTSEQSDDHGDVSDAKAASSTPIRVLSQQRTPLGGAIGIITVFGLLVIIVALSMRYTWDNATLTLTQRPSGIAPGAVFSTPRLRISFLAFGVDPVNGCTTTASGGGTGCVAALASSMTATALSPAATTSTSCRVVDNTICEISWLCEDCGLVETPTVTFSPGTDTPFLRSVMVKVEIAAGKLPFGTEGGSALVEFFLAPSSSDMVFQLDGTGPTASALRFVGYQAQTVDFRDSESNPKRTLGYGLTEGKVVSRGAEVALDDVVLVPSPGATGVSVSIASADYHTVYEVRLIDSFLAFAGVLGGAISALLGIGTLIIKSVERFLKFKSKATAASKKTPGAASGSGLLDLDPNSDSYTFATHASGSVSTDFQSSE